jgi:hypothetical protein
VSYFSGARQNRESESDRRAAIWIASSIIVTGLGGTRPIENQLSIGNFVDETLEYHSMQINGLFSIIQTDEIQPIPVTGLWNFRSAPLLCDL